MSEVFGIDIVIHPDVAAGKAAVVKSLEEIQGRGVTASRGVGDAFRQLHRDLKSEFDGIGGQLNAALRGAERQGLSAANKVRQAMAAESAKFQAATAKIGGGPAFGDLGREMFALDGQAGDLFEGWKAGAAGAAANTNRLAQITGGLTSTLSQVGMVVGAAFAVKKVIDYSDAYTNLQNKLGTVTESSEELADVTSKLFQLSNDTRSSFTATGAFYARLAANTKDLGLSTDDLLGITSTLTKAFKISGATSAESGAAMIQLSQGLASGTLRGEELNSVLEQAPMLGRAIAESMGIPFGKLREVASQGKITAAEVIAALQGMKGEIDEKFSKTAPTFGDLFTKLENTLVSFAGKLGPALAPVLNAFDGLIGAAGPALDIIATGMGNIATIGGPILAVLGEAIALAGKLLGVVADVVEGIAGARAELARELGGDVNDVINDPRTQELMKARADHMTAAIKLQVGQYNELETAILLSRHAEMERAGFSTGVSPAVLAALKAQKAEYERMGEVGVKSLVDINTTMGLLPGTIANIKIKQIGDDFAVLDQLERRMNPAIEATEQMESVTRALAQKFKEGKLSVIEFATQLGVYQAELFNTADATKAVTDVIDAINKAIAKEQERKDKAAAEAFKALKASVRGLVEAYDPLIKMSREYDEAVALVTKGVRKNLITEQQANGILEEKLRLFRALDEVQFSNDLGGEAAPGDGAFNAAFENQVQRRGEVEAAYYDEQYAKQLRWMDAQDQMAAKLAEREPWQKALDNMASVDLQTEAITAGFQGMMSGIDDLLAGNIRSWKDLGAAVRSVVSNMIADLARLAVQQAFAQLLGGVAGGGTAPIPWTGAPGSIQIPKYAGGGSVGGSSFPHIPGATGADSHVAAFRVSPDERVDILTPTQQRAQAEGGGGSGRAANGKMTVAVEARTDPDAFYAVFGSARFEREVVRVVTKHGGAIARRGR